MIRKATIEDLPSIHNLYKILFDRMAELEPNYMKPAPQDDTFIQRVICEEDNFSIFVAEYNNEVQGFAIAQLQNTPPYNCFVQQRCVYLMDLVVNPNTRSKGLGKELINAVKKWGITYKADYFELSVLSDNNRAIALYEKEGFTTFNQSMRMRLDSK